MPKPVVQVGDDPDPTPYLFVSLEMKRIDQSKPYDSKKACWVPDEKEGYILGEIKATKGELISVTIPGGEVMYLRPFVNFDHEQRCRNIHIHKTYTLLNSKNTLTQINDTFSHIFHGAENPEKGPHFTSQPTEIRKNRRHG
jgi:myosin heavy chain 6/7